ncbi:MAG: (Fe-S)-binding protein [Gammaproteobacteria bacterium]|nr:(Fe-S)-binding protein [Gammaproteobacteria bacterium]
MSLNYEAFNQFAEMAGQLADMDTPVEMPNDQRVANAKRVMMEKMDAPKAAMLESCIHCGMCAEVCHFYMTQEDGRLTPIRKLDLLKRVYRRELSPLRWMHRLYTRDVTIEDLEEWQELVYDTCTVCGRCSLICPMGIHIAAMMPIMRNAYAAAGMVPAELHLMDSQQDQGHLFGVGQNEFMGLIEQLRGQGLEIPVDKDKADIMILTSVLDIMVSQDSLVAMIKIMNHLGYDWTFRSDGYECANFGMLSGDEEVQLKASKRIIDAAIACGAKKVIVAECGHSYPALRYEAPDIWGHALPFEVLATSEFLGQEVEKGRLKLKKAEGAHSVTFHDPCKNNRWGGVEKEPRAVLTALGLEIREPESTGRTNICCGGGGGAFLINRAAERRQRVFELKRDQIDATGSEALVVTCGSCRLNFEVGKMKSNWGKPIESLVEMVGDNLDDGSGESTTRTAQTSTQ